MQVYGESLISRAAHVIQPVEDNFLIIFGGVGAPNKNENQVLGVEFDPREVSMLVKDERYVKAHPPGDEGEDATGEGEVVTTSGLITQKRAFLADA